MISYFFIDRPIFATVLSVVITLIGGIALRYLPVAQYPRITPPGVVVSISYPGASAKVVADTVAAPIEQSVNGVENMLYMSSQMGNDGTYTLTATFDIGTDLKTALVMVQNRVTLAMPQLPIEVQNQGITIRKKTPDILMIVNFFSPDGRYDDVYLSNYATIYVKDELLRVDGVSDITYQGQRDYSIRVWLDPQKMASCNMTATDVANAIRKQNLDAPVGQLGQQPAPKSQLFQLPLNTLGRLAEPEQFEEIIVKVGPAQGRSSQPAAMASGGSRGSSLGSAGMGLPGIGMTSSGISSSMTSSGISNGSMTSSGVSSGSMNSNGISGTGTSGTTSSGVPGTSGGGTNSGGATSSGGGVSGGGANTGGGGTSSPGVYTPRGAPASLTLPPMSTIVTGNGILSGAAQGRGPGLPAASIVRLKDVARVEQGALNYTQSCTFDGQPAVGLGLYQLPGTNALDVAKAVRKRMEELKQRFPPGVAYDIAYDTTPFIRESVEDVVYTMFEAVALVGFVVLIFLQDWRAMVLPMIDVPVSIIGTFAVMLALGFSLNNISLFGLVLAIGIVVDDAIVVLENIERMLATGLEVRTATMRAMDEVTGPIMAVALVLCAVFVPCAFISGITGQFFRQFAVTIAVSTVISAINAITMTPSRAVLIFKAGREHKREALPWWSFLVAAGLVTAWIGPEWADRITAWIDPEWAEQLGLVPAAAAAEGWRFWALMAVYFTPGALAGGLVGWLIIRPVNAALGWLFHNFNRGFDAMSGGYGWVVGRLLRGHVVVLLVYFGLIGLTYYVFQRSPTGFIPQQDQGRLIVNIQLPDSASLERTKEATAKIANIARETEGVAHTVATAGLSYILQANSPNLASMFIVLKPFGTRPRDTAIMKELRQRWTAEVKEAQVMVYGASPIPGLGVAGGFKLIVEDRGGLGLGELQQNTDRLVGALREMPFLNNVSTQFRSNTPQLYLDIDRAKAASLGVSINDLNETLDIYLGSLYVNSYNAYSRDWQVTVQADGRYRTQVEDINLFQVRNRQGQMVPLGTLVTARETGGPISVTRYDLFTAASINGNIQGVSTGDAIKAIQEKAHDVLPRSMDIEWTELMFIQIRAGDTTLPIFGLAVMFVFLALSALYESWSLPLAVILVVPLCLLCSLAGVLCTGRDVNIFVQIGLVVLVGLACKNAILIVEYAKQLNLEGRPVFEATKEASRMRLRPILMTSFAFIFGVIPLIIASGAGAEMRRSLGIAVFYGMLGVTLFGIFLTPVFFYLLQGMSGERLLASDTARQVASWCVGGLLGAAIAYLFALVHVVSLPAGLSVGGCLGAALNWVAFEFRRRRRLKSALAAKKISAPPPGANGSIGGRHS